MILHTDTLTPEDVHDAARRFNLTAMVTVRGSRDRARALDMTVHGSGRLGHGTWDETGAVLGALFAADPGMRVGNRSHPIYSDRDDFRESTGGRYENGMPSDAHARHRWESDWAGRSYCANCSAMRYQSQAVGFGR